MSKELAIHYAKQLHARVRRIWELSSQEGVASIQATSEPTGPAVQAEEEETTNPNKFQCVFGSSAQPDEAPDKQSPPISEGKQMDTIEGHKRRKKFRLRVAKAVAYVMLGLLIGGMVFVWWSNQFFMAEVAYQVIPEPGTVGGDVPRSAPLPSEAPGNHGIPSEVIVAIISSVAGYGGHRLIDLLYKIAEKKLGLSNG